jgi:hypothetical protein
MGGTASKEVAPFAFKLRQQSNNKQVSKRKRNRKVTDKWSHLNGRTPRNPQKRRFLARGWHNTMNMPHLLSLYT